MMWVCAWALPRKSVGDEIQGALSVSVGPKVERPENSHKAHGTVMPWLAETAWWPKVHQVHLFSVWYQENHAWRTLVNITVASMKNLHKSVQFEHKNSQGMLIDEWCSACFYCQLWVHVLLMKALNNPVNAFFKRLTVWVLSPNCP